jgi:hypothetical protein
VTGGESGVRSGSVGVRNSNNGVMIDMGGNRAYAEGISAAHARDPICCVRGR